MLLAGCDRSQFVGVRYRESQDLTFFVPLCGDGRLVELRVQEGRRADGSYGELLWGIRATGAAREISKIEFGTAPPGFETFGTGSFEALEDEHPTDLLSVRTVTTGQNARAVFELDSLSPGGLIDFSESGPQAVQVDEAAGALEGQCTPTRVLPFSVAAAMAGACLLVTYIVRRRRRRSRRIST